MTAGDPEAATPPPRLEATASVLHLLLGLDAAGSRHGQAESVYLAVTGKPLEANAGTSRAIGRALALHGNDTAAIIGLAHARLQIFAGAKTPTPLVARVVLCAPPPLQPQLPDAGQQAGAPKGKKRPATGDAAPASASKAARTTTRTSASSARGGGTTTAGGTRARGLVFACFFASANYR
jgi:hypothetical protein